MLTRTILSAVLNLIYQDKIQDQFRRDVVLPNLLEVEDGAGEACTWPVKFHGRTAGGAYAEGADMVDADFDTNTPAKALLNWAEYRTGAKVSGLAQAIAEASGNGDAFVGEIDDAIDELSLKIGPAMYSGNPAATPIELAGAATAIDSAAGTYAGINSATHPDWVSGENTIDLADLSFANIRTKLFRPIKNATGRDPDLATCRGDVWDAIKELFGDKAPVVQSISTSRGTIDITAATGARALIIDGVPLVEDRHATASTIYGWTTRHVKIRQIPVNKSRVDPNELVKAMKVLTGVDIDVSDVEARLRARSKKMIPSIELLGQTGDAYKAQIKWYGQMVWKSRNGHSKLILT